MRKSRGIPSLAAVLVDDAISDLLYAPKASAAYRTAAKFINGGECSHVVCADCVVNDDWRSGECPREYPADCRCGHDWGRHLVLVFDWSEHRDVLAGAAGIEPGALRGATQCMTVPTAGDDTPPPSTSSTSSTASKKS